MLIVLEEEAEKYQIPQKYYQINSRTFKLKDDLACPKICVCRYFAALFIAELCLAFCAFWADIINHLPTVDRRLTVFLERKDKWLLLFGGNRSPFGKKYRDMKENANQENLQTKKVRFWHC